MPSLHTLIPKSAVIQSITVQILDAVENTFLLTATVVTVPVIANTVDDLF
jgi:hypothetical protein